MSYLSLFENHTAYTNGTSTLSLPNVSYDHEHVHFKNLPKANGHEYVDLGLPSGTLWATCNVGASSPEQYGDCYAWGEIETKHEPTYTLQNYRFYPGNDEDEYTKYNDTDNKMSLDLEDDVAHVIMGGDWHIPSEAQFNELIANTTSSWTTDYNGAGVTGAVFTSNINGNSIFFHAAGGLFDEGPEGHDEKIEFWSASRDSFYGSALGLYGDVNSRNVDFYNRFGGILVRGVIGKIVENTATVNIDGSSSTITFTEGMTWRQYCQSSYNTLGFTIDENHRIVRVNNSGWIELDDPDPDVDPEVDIDDAIIKNANYIWQIAA